MKITLISSILIILSSFNSLKSQVAEEYIVPNKSLFKPAIDELNKIKEKPKDNSYSYQFVYRKYEHWIAFRYYNNKIEYVYLISNKIGRGVEKLTTYDSEYLNTLIIQPEPKELIPYLSDDNNDCINVSYKFPNGEQRTYSQFTPFSIDQYYMKDSKEIASRRSTTADYQYRSIHLLIAGLAKQSSNLARVITIPNERFPNE